MNVYFEALNKDNCKEAVDIYNYYVTETTVSYATEPIEAEEFISYLNFPHQ